MKEMAVRVVVSGSSVALLALHVVRPDLKVDAVVVGLLVVAVLPWLSSVFESIEFPGGGGVTYRKAKEAGEVIISGSPATTAPARTGQVLRAPLMPLATDDANLQFVALRIAIEKVLAELAENYGKRGARTTRELLRQLVEAGALEPEVARAVSNLVLLGNRAAHGKSVDEELGRWARETGPDIIAALERRVAREP